jgi:hypothetical protein
MSQGIKPTARRLCVALAVMSSLPATVVFADTVTLSPAAWSSALDGGTSTNPVVDGQFDTLIPGSYLYVRKNQGTKIQSELRADFEFVLPDAVLQPGTTINNVTLTVPVMSQTVAGNDALTVYGYVAGGTITLADFSDPISVAQTSLFSGLPTSASYINVPYYMQLFPGSGNNRVGFVSAVSNWGTSLLWGSGATLQITYTPPVGSPPSLTVLAPSDGTVYPAGSNVSLQATFTDPVDGSRDWGIRWSSNVSGWLGDGGNLTVSLPAGTHLITATGTDTNGNTVAKGRIITIK